MSAGALDNEPSAVQEMGELLDWYGPRDFFDRHPGSLTNFARDPESEPKTGEEPCLVRLLRGKLAPCFGSAALLSRCSLDSGS